MLRHSQQQQATLKVMETEQLSRQPSKGALDVVLQGNMSNNKDSSMQLLAQVLPTICVT